MKFCGLTVTNDAIYEAIVTNEATETNNSTSTKAPIKVVSRKKYARTSSVSRDLELRFKELKDKGYIFGVVQVNEPHFNIISTPPSATLPTLVNQAEAFVESKDDDFTYDYMVQKGDDGNLLFIVGLQKAMLNEFNKAILLTHSNVRLIDYWPAPLQHVNTQREETVVQLTEEDGVVHGYLWNQMVLLAHDTWNKETTTPQEFLLQLLAKAPTPVSNTVKFMAYLSKKNHVLWESVLHEYGEVDTTVIEDVQNHYSKTWQNNPFMDAAVGMAYRWARRSA